MSLNKLSILYLMSYALRSHFPSKSIAFRNLIETSVIALPDRCFEFVNVRTEDFSAATSRTFSRFLQAIFTTFRQIQVLGSARKPLPVPSQENIDVADAVDAVDSCCGC